MTDFPSSDTPTTDLGEQRFALLQQVADLAEQVPASVASTRALRDGLLVTTRRHLAVRHRHADLPPLVAVIGPGGVGKSHLVNGVVGQRVSPEGPLRPTTTAPVAIAPKGASEAAWAEMVGALRAIIPEIHLVDADADRTGGAAVVDLPASGSQGILDLADAVVIVTSPGRYGDAATWDLVDDVVGHGLAHVVVLNRAAGTDDEVAADLTARLLTAGLDGPVVTVPAGGDIEPVRDALETVLGQSDTGAPRTVAAIADRVDVLADATQVRVDEEQALREMLDRVSSTTADEMRRSIEERPMPGAAARPWNETAERLADVVTHRIGDAASGVASQWSAHPLGAALLADHGETLWRHPSDASLVAAQAVLGWPAAVERLVIADAKRSLRPHIKDALVEAVSDRALGGSVTVRRRLNRKLRSGVDEVGLRARTALGDIAGDMVIADRARFLERLAGGPDPSLPGSLRKVAADLRATVEEGSLPVAVPPEGVVADVTDEEPHVPGAADHDA